MLLKGNVSVIVELGKTEWEAKPVGVAFGNWFFGVLVYQKRAAELLRAPAEPEQTCPTCETNVMREVMYCDYCQNVENVTGKSNRSGRG